MKALRQITVGCICVLIPLIGLILYGNWQSGQIIEQRRESPQEAAIQGDWKALYNFRAKTNAFDLTVKPSRVAYRLGEAMSLTVTSEKAGRVWVLYVDPNSKAKAMFPNTLSGDNHIEAGVALQIPGKSADWFFEAAPPLGRSIFAVIVTTESVKPHDVLVGLFKQPQTKALLSWMDYTSKNEDWALARSIVHVETNY